MFTSFSFFVPNEEDRGAGGAEARKGHGGAQKTGNDKNEIDIRKQKLTRRDPKQGVFSLLLL